MLTNQSIIDAVRKSF